MIEEFNADKFRQFIGSIQKRVGEILLEEGFIAGAAAIMVTEKLAQASGMDASKVSDDTIREEIRKIDVEGFKKQYGPLSYVGKNIS